MQLSQNLSQHVLQYGGQYYPLNKPEITIGSDQSCDIRIENNPQVLPMHARIVSRTGQVFLTYMQRGAAIWVNGLPVSQQALQDQDEIAVGDLNTRLKLLLNRNSVGTPSPVNQSTRLQAMLSNGGAMPQAPISMPQAQFPTSAMSDKATDTTRYLCAAGHLDEDFQDYVMRHVIYEERRALGESYGVDMSAVVSWCKSGLRRINKRDLVLTGILVLVILSYFLVNAMIRNLLANPNLSYSLYTILQGATQLFSVTTIVLALIILPIAFNFEKWLKRHWPGTLPGVITYPTLLVLFFPFSLFIVPLIWGTIFSELIIRYYGQQTNLLRKNTFNPQARPVPLDNNLAKKLQENFSTGQRNVVAYSGFTPFAGAGIYREDLSWSFVIDTSKGAFDPSDFTGSAKRLIPQSFPLSSLYHAVEMDVWDLGIKDVLEIEGKLYVRGQYLPEKPAFFNAAVIHPVTSVDPQLIEQYKEHPTEDVRYYQCMRFNFWRGEMILTAFLRFVQRGKELFTEIDYLLLPPMKPDYYWVDERELTPLLKKIWELYKRSFNNPIRIWLGAPSRLLRGYSYTSAQNRLAHFARNAPAFDYGASTSVRQSASDDVYHLFFQKLDEKMYLKIIEKQILETAINFLDAHQIDTTELRQRAQVILNSNTTNNSTFNNHGTITNSGGMVGNLNGGQVNNNSSQPSHS